MVNTQCISRVPPQRAKPKGRNMTESEKKQVTLGAKGEKKGQGDAQYVGSTRLITRGHAQPWNTTSNVSKQCGTKREGGLLVL